MVDGVLASCYASTYHDLAYMGMVPLQSFPKVMEWIFGNDNGNLVYAKLAEDFWYIGCSIWGDLWIKLNYLKD